MQASGSEEMRYLTSPENRASDLQLARNPTLTIGNSSRKGFAFLSKISSYNRSMVAHSMFATLMRDCNLCSVRSNSTVKLCRDLN